MELERIETLDEAMRAVQQLTARTSAWRRGDIRSLWLWARTRAGEQLRLWDELRDIEHELRIQSRHWRSRQDTNAAHARVVARMSATILDANGTAADLESQSYNFETVGMPFLFVRALQATQSGDPRRRQRVRNHLLPLFVEAATGRELVIAVLTDLVNEGRRVLAAASQEDGADRVRSIENQWRLALRLMRTSGSRMVRLFPEMADHLD